MILWQLPTWVVLSLGWFPPGAGQVYKCQVDFTLREIFCIHPLKKHLLSSLLYVTSIFQYVYLSVLMGTLQGEGEAHFRDCFLKRGPHSWFYFNLLPRELALNSSIPGSLQKGSKVCSLEANYSWIEVKLWHRF